MNNPNRNFNHFPPNETAARCHCRALSTGRRHIRRELDAHLRRSPSKRILILESTDVSLPSVLSTATDRNPTDSGWDYIYSVALFTALPDNAAKSLLQRAAQSLRPGGILLAANTLSDVKLDICRSCAREQRHYRTEQDLAALAADISSFLITSQTVYRDQSGFNAYLELVACQTRFPLPSVGVVSSAVQ